MTRTCLGSRKEGGMKKESRAQLIKRLEKTGRWIVRISTGVGYNDFKWQPIDEKNFGGSLDVRGCDLKGVKLPASVGGSLDVRGCDLKGVKLPDCMIIR